MSDKKDRERFERTGKVFRSGQLVPLNKAYSEKDRDRERSNAISTLQTSSTSNQVGFLSKSLHTGRLSPSKLRKELEKNAPKEMRKGADKLIKKGKPLTVDRLLEEYRKEKEFKALASEVGLKEEWFIALAESEIRRRG